ncbi:MAG: hypothetical protein AAGD38_14765 [Acidobacteriota bacterium]
MTRLTTVLAVVLLAILLAAPASGQATQNFTVSVMGGIGGSGDADVDSGYDNFGLQGLFSLKLTNNTRFGLRVGQTSLEADDESGLFDADLTWLTAVGEYEYPDVFFDGGLYLGLGAYDLQGDNLIGDESGIGLTLGSTGDFRFTPSLSVRVELSGHFVDFDYGQFFFMGHVGLAYHF